MLHTQRRQARYQAYGWLYTRTRRMDYALQFTPWPCGYGAKSMRALLASGVQGFASRVFSVSRSVCCILLNCSLGLALIGTYVRLVSFLFLHLPVNIQEEARIASTASRASSPAVPCAVLSPAVNARATAAREGPGGLLTVAAEQSWLPVLYAFLLV